MSKVTLDIICETAFGYRTDSLHNPHNELAEAYEELVNMQDGRMLARFIALVSIPGAARFLQSDLAYRWREVLGRFVQRKSSLARQPDQATDYILLFHFSVLLFMSFATSKKLFCA